MNLKALLNSSLILFAIMAMCVLVLFSRDKEQTYIHPPIKDKSPMEKRIEKIEKKQKQIIRAYNNKRNYIREY